MEKTVLKNTSWIFSSSIYSYAIKIIIIILISRVYGLAMYGVYAFVESFSLLLVHFSNMGQLEYAIRESCKDTKKKMGYLSNLFPIKMIVWAVLYALLIIVVFTITSDTIYRQGFIIIGISALFHLLSLQFRVVFRSSELMKYEAYLTFFRSTTTLALLSLFVFLGYSIIAIFLTSALSGLLALGVGIIIMRQQFFMPRFTFDIKTIKEIFFGSFPFFLARTCYKIKYRLPGWLVFFFFGASAFGVFAIAYKPIMKIGEFTRFFEEAIYPRFCKLLNKKRALHSLFWKAFSLVALYGLASSLAVIIFSPYLASLLFAEPTQQAVLLMQAIAAGLFLYSVNSIFSFYLFAEHKAWTEFWISLSTLLLMLALGGIIVPTYGIIGAGMLIIITSGASLVLKIAAVLDLQLKGEEPIKRHK